MRYRAIQVKQADSDKKLALFAAPSSEIEQWAGVPQKKRFGGSEPGNAEAVGFQREVNPLRVKSLKRFYADPENIIQNPLLCATREAANASVTFIPDDGAQGDIQSGYIEIQSPDYDQLSLHQIIAQVRAYLERRLPEVISKAPSASLVQALKLRAAQEGLSSAPSPEAAPNGDAGENSDTDGQSAAEKEVEDASAVLFEESHLLDFWQEIAARDEVLKIIDSEVEKEFLGFTRDALLAYLKPVVLVDGQHRLSGALEAGRERLDSDAVQNEIEARIATGDDANAVTADLMKRYARQLPVSLLLSTDPAEQVFQFIVVNQKATPIGRALLGTIVSTTLSNDEMGRVASRIKDAGIQLEESQAITYLARLPESPFFNLVERGLAGDASDLLQWNVFASLIGIFRELRGGKLFGQKNDYAEIWRTKYLNDSPIVANYATERADTPFDYWRQLNGPWRDVFIAFWSQVRDKFGDVKDPDRWNYWGRTSESNLFNKVSLTILAADFFQFLTETRRPLSSADEIPALVSEWLEDVNLAYFDKDWNLGGIKKDSTGIRSQWAAIWSDYRKSGGNLPDKRNFRTAKA